MVGGNFLVKGSFSPIETPTSFKMFGDGTSQVRSFENQTATNIVSFLNIEPEESDSNGHSFAEDEVYNEIEDQENICDDRTNSIRSCGGTTWLGLILLESLIWSHFV